MPTHAFAGRDILSVKDFSKTELLHVLSVAKALKKNPQPHLLAGKVLATCFFEPSTRTRLSFESAMQHLGGSVIGFDDPTNTSTKKGETLHDSMRIIGQYADAIAIRHPLDGAARLAAAATNIPIINAGDGANQHPTQTLLDLFTIQEKQKKLEGLSIAFVGDLKYGRTVHSLTQALAHFNVRLFYVAPEMLQLPPYLLDVLKSSRRKYSLHKKMEEVLPQVDVLYMTRIQQERFGDQADYEKVKDAFTLSPGHLTHAKKNLSILHPLPRISELEPAVDDLPQAHYFDQAANGVFVREAVLALVLGKR